MDIATILALIKSALVPLVVFLLLLLFTMIRGRRATTSLILGLYFALLLSLKFPYYDKLYDVLGGVLSEAIISIIAFVVFTVVFAALMDRLLFYRIDEGLFEGFLKKLLLALSATVLVMAYSYHVLPVTVLVDPGPTATLLFGPDQYFFWWMLAPLAVLWFAIY